MKIIADKLLQTCMACPSQWDGVTDDDRAVYVRYRWGILAVHVGAIGDTSKFAALDGENIVNDEIGDGYDGLLTQSELLVHLSKHGLLDVDATESDPAEREKAKAVMDKASESLTQMIEAGTVKVLR